MVSSHSGEDPQAGEAHSTASSAGKAPTALDLIRLSPAEVFPPGGEELYRQIALLTELAADQVALEAPCGRGIGTEFLSRITGAECHGVDPSAALVQQATERVRASGTSGEVRFESSSLEDLPYRDEIFDLAIGGLGMNAVADPARAIAELARVTRPMGAVVLIQLIWTGNLDAPRREELVEHLGVRPLLLVEWKQLLRDAGVVDLHVEDWSDHASPFRPAAGGPLHDLSELFSLREKALILRRAFHRWGLKGVRGAVVREAEIHRLLSRERVLGLSLIRGTKWQGAALDGEQKLPIEETRE